MSDEHPGFDYWSVNDAAHPFPVGSIDLVWSAGDGAEAFAEFTLPQAQPTARTVAERYIGVAHSTQLWFALECTTQANGQVSCEAVLRGRHVHWYPDHGETGGGPVQEVRLSAGDLAGGGGRREALRAHGPHCDLFVVFWNRGPQGEVRCDLTVLHFPDSVDDFIRIRLENKRKAEHGISPFRPSITLPIPTPTPAPKPTGPGADGT